MTVTVWKYLAAYLGVSGIGAWLFIGAVLYGMRWSVQLPTKGSFGLSLLFLGSIERWVALTFVL